VVEAAVNDKACMCAAAAAAQTEH